MADREEVFRWASGVSIPKRMRGLLGEKRLSQYWADTIPVLNQILSVIRPLGEKKLAASTQHVYTKNALRWINIADGTNHYKNIFIKELLKNLKIQSLMHTKKAPSFSLDVLIQMFKDTKPNPRMQLLFYIAFLTAARIGHLHHLQFHAAGRKGWRFTWTYHKTFWRRGALDVLIPNECIPESLSNIHKSLTQGALICTEAEKTQLFALIQKAFNNRTHTVRRSSCQHMRFTLGMSLESIIEISLHADTKSLEGYLASPAVSQKK